VKAIKDIEVDTELWLNFRAKLTSGDYELSTGCESEHDDVSVNEDFNGGFENRNDEMINEPLSLKWLQLLVDIRCQPNNFIEKFL